MSERVREGVHASRPAREPVVVEEARAKPKRQVALQVPGAWTGH